MLPKKKLNSKISTNLPLYSTQKGRKPDCSCLFNLNIELDINTFFIRKHLPECYLIHLYVPNIKFLLPKRLNYLVDEHYF